MEAIAKKNRTYPSRPLQPGAHLCVPLAVLSFVLAGPILAETHQTSINADGGLVAPKRVMRSALAQDEDADSLAEGLPGPLGSLGKLANAAKDHLPVINGKDYLMFSWDAGGVWDGLGDEHDGEVGFEFEPQKDMNLTALGRHVKGHWRQRDNGGINLFEEVNVTLWYVLPKDVSVKPGTQMESLAMTSVMVGPDDKWDPPEVGGKYNFRKLDKKVALQAHERYRITQSCYKGMRDKWFDGDARNHDIENYGLTECVKVTNGVRSDKARKYPVLFPPEKPKKKGTLDLFSFNKNKNRNVGMLNARFEVEAGCGNGLPKSSKEARDDAKGIKRAAVAVR